MSKPLTVSEINQLRMLIKKGYATPAQTPEQRRATQNTKRAAFRADALGFAQQLWDEGYAAILESKPAFFCPEYSLGLRPTTNTHAQQERYREYLASQSNGDTHEGED